MSAIDFKQDLEFDKVLELIANKCVSELGKARLMNSTPMFVEEDISHELSLVDETKSIFLSASGLPVWSFSDIRSLLVKIEPLESYLDAQECQQVQNLLEMIAELIQFFVKQENRYPLLQSLVKNLINYQICIN